MTNPHLPLVHLKYRKLKRRMKNVKKHNIEQIRKNKYMQFGLHTFENTVYNRCS